jgi:ABC-type taurine transport system ATPase subunit
VRALKSDPAFIALREHLLDTLARHRQAHDKETA